MSIPSRFIIALIYAGLGAQKFVRIVAALHAADGMISTIIVACYGGGLLGGAFTAMLFSLAGIPLTVGFIARFPCDRGWLGAASWPVLCLRSLSAA